jgi:lipid II isoglutaminyl synthase (glutamine-hydrolysing)
LETDERVVGDVIRLGGPEVLVLLNFSRDQLDRHHKSKGWVAAGARHWLTRAQQDLSSSPTQTKPLIVIWASGRLLSAEARP